MKTCKKILCSLLVVVMCLTSAPLQGFVGMEWPELPEINFGEFELPKIDFSSWFGGKASAVEDTLAPTGQCGDDVYWNYNSTTGELVISGTGKMQNYNPEASVFNNSNIRSIIIENGVTSIGEWAFAYCENLTNVSIPESITEIGDVAFRSCSSLASITIPDSVNYIGGYAFYETAYYFDDANWEGEVLYIDEFLMHSKETISGDYQIKNGTRVICGYAFSERLGLTGVFIPNSVSTIDDQAFLGCWGLTSIVIPDSVTTIGAEAFISTPYLEKVTVGKGIKNIGYGAFQYCGVREVYISDMKCWCNIKFANDESNPFNSDANIYLNGILVEDIVIPDSITSINDFAFCGLTSLKSVTFHSNLKSIGKEAFSGCTNLKSIAIPDSVIDIGDKAFYKCSNLADISLGKGVTTIGRDAIKNTAYYNDASNWENDAMYMGEYLIAVKSSISGEYNIKPGTRVVADYAFYNCEQLTSVTVPEGVIAVSDGMFSECAYSLMKVTLPSSIKSIGDNAFHYNLSLCSVNIPEGVTYIGVGAFSACSLMSLEIPDSVTRIGERAFANSAITTITLGNGISEIEIETFAECPYLKNITIPDSVTTIGHYAFLNCENLTSVTIGKSVKIIGDSAFHYCDSLTSITVDENNQYYSNDEYGVLFNKDKTTLVQYPIGNTRTFYAIPDSVTTIGKYAFNGCKNLTNVTIGDSVTTIGDNAFHECTSLTNITIGDSVTTIGDWAFCGCYYLTSIVFPNSVTTIGDYAFRSCNSLTSVTITGNATTIGKEAFSWCNNLTNVTIDDSVTTIGSYAFNSCENLTSVTIGENVKIIDDCVFSYCYGLTSITVDKNNQYYSNDEYGVLFNKDKTTLVQYPIGNTRTFYAIPDSVTTIGKYAFNGCKNLTNVTIGDSVTTIGDYSFNYCENLISITIGDRVTIIGDYAFYGCNSLASITIPDRVTIIGDYAFYGCSSLTKVTIPNSVTTIGDEALSYCGSLTSITIPASVTTIGAHAFSGCYSLVSIIIPDSVTTIGEGTFSYCDSLISVTIGDRVTTIGDGAFNECSSLTNITIGDSVTTIGYRAFWYCFSLTNVYYQGSKEQWRNIKIEENNYNLLNSRIHFNSNKYSHTVYTSEVTKKSTCTEEGVRTYTCHCGGGVYTVSIPKVAHSYKSTITKAATCAQAGVRTYTCVCGDSYTESIPKIPHSYKSSITRTATCAQAGVRTYTCSCGSSYTESIPKLTQHTDGDGNGYCDICSGFVGVDVPSVTSTTYKGVTATLSNDYFSGDSKVYNHDLAKFCSLFTVIGYEYNKEKIKGYLEECGFSADKKYIVTNASKEQVNNFISHKEIVVNQKVYTLVFAGYIGSYKEQWYSNFDPGTGTTHKGFINAKNYVYPILEDYIKGLGVSKEETIILLTGHSRGAATSNLVAKQLIDDEKYATKENIYTYAFATPNSTSLSERKAEKYKRIINIVNPEDLVTKVLPSDWDYGRYGVTYTLPSKTNLTKNYYNTLKNNMQKEYALLLDGESYHPYPGGESQTYDLVYSMTKNVKNITQLYERKFRWFGEYISVQEFITQTLCRYMASDKGSEAKNEAQALVVATWLDRFDNSGLILDFADYFVIYQGLGGLTSGVIMDDYFQEAHQAETYCAYVMSMTKGQVTSPKDSYKGSVNCPVDVEIYDKSNGELVGRIVDNVVDEEVATGENAIVMTVDGDSKSFWLPSDGDYEIKLIGNDEGLMDYTISEIDSDVGETKRVNFFDVEITDGLTMTADVDAEGFVIEEHELAFENGETLEPTEIFTEENIETYNIDISTSEGGSASSSQTAKSGDYVSLDAEADKCWEFIGWYENDKLISTETELAFVAKSNRSIEARFKFDKHTFGDLYEIKPATCEESGVEQRDCSACNYSETQNIPATGHNYNNGVCTSCGDDLTANCSCNCHAGGIKGLIFKLILFFQKLFRMNRICKGCGVSHY